MEQQPGGLPHGTSQTGNGGADGRHEIAVGDHGRCFHEIPDVVDLQLAGNEAVAKGKQPGRCSAPAPSAETTGARGAAGEGSEEDQAHQAASWKQPISDKAQAGVDGTEHERKRDGNEQRFTFAAMEKPMSAITITSAGDRPATTSRKQLPRPAVRPAAKLPNSTRPMAWEDQDAGGPETMKLPKAICPPPARDPR